MPATYEPIASVTTSGTSQVEFTSIPGTYTDLVVVCYLTGTTSSGIYMRMNGDTGSNYSHTNLEADGSGAYSGRITDFASVPVGFYSYGVSTTNRVVAIAHIMSYANTNVYKTVLSSGADAATSLSRMVGLWRSTSAITSLKFDVGSGFSTRIASGSVISLYGIKAA